MQRNIEDRIVILGDIRIRAKSIKNYGLLLNSGIMRKYIIAEQN